MINWVQCSKNFFEGDSVVSQNEPPPHAEQAACTVGACAVLGDLIVKAVYYPPFRSQSYPPVLATAIKASFCSFIPESAHKPCHRRAAFSTPLTPFFPIHHPSPADPTLTCPVINRSDTLDRPGAAHLF